VCAAAAVPEVTPSTGEGAHKSNKPPVALVWPLSTQVFNELRARMSSSLHSCTYVVLPLHISTSREGGALMVYPFAGTSMDTVCSQLRGAGQREELVRLLARMSTSVLLTLQKLQAHKPKVCV
jgi:hypothetical protein